MVMAGTVLLKSVTAVHVVCRSTILCVVLIQSLTCDLYNYLPYIMPVDLHCLIAA